MPTPEATPEVDPLAWLLEHRQYWPREVKLLRNENFLVMVNDSFGGTVKANAGNLVQLRFLEPGYVTVALGGNEKRISIDAKDVAERARQAMDIAMARESAAAGWATARATAEAARPGRTTGSKGSTFDASQKITAASFRSQGYPRLYAAKDASEDLKKKIQNVEWAKNIYDGLKESVQPLVERHKRDPQYIVSRLMMNWKEGSHFTDFDVPGEKSQEITIRKGDAPYATVTPDFTRIGSGGPPRNMDEWTVYYDGTGKIATDGGAKDPKDAGMIPGLTNKKLLDLAANAAVVYYVTGDKDYAKFAADIFWTFARGASYQNAIAKDLGLFSFETIGDNRRYSQIPVIYDLIHDYLAGEYFNSEEFKKGRKGELWAPGHPEGKDWAMERIHTFFQKYMDNKIECGGGLEGNWNMYEHESAMRYALVMDDDKSVKNGKGREYYTTQFLIGPTTPTHGAYLDVAKANLSPKTGLWPEAPAGYGQNAVANLIKFGYWYNIAGFDVLGSDPLIKKAGVSFPQVIFPNGYATGWGDGGYGLMNPETGEYMIAYARAHGDKETEAKFTDIMSFAGERKPDSIEALFFYVPELETVEKKIAMPRVSYSETHSLIIERNLEADPADSLAYSVYGSGEKSGHRHDNGMAIELYGRGHVQGVDPGAGPTYWDKQHHTYNRHVAAHNTVIPNGMFSSGRQLDMKIEAAEPMVDAGVNPTFQASPFHQFTDTSIEFDGRAGAGDKDGKADQRRVMGIVRTSPKGGFYVDIFRSRIIKDKDVSHDYLYHNMGSGFSLFDTDGKELALKPENFDESTGPGYAFFSGAKGAPFANDFSGVFNFGEDNAKMGVWMIGQSDRTVYSAEATRNFRFYIPRLRELTVPTLIVRQKGEAWNRPFAAVYEPYGNGLDSTVKRVRRMKNAPDSGEFVGIAVEHQGALAGRIDYVVNSTKDSVEQTAEDVQFKGIYGAATVANGKCQSLYLGSGQRIATKDVMLASQGGENISAALYRDERGNWKYSSDKPVRISVPGRQMMMLPAAQDTALPLR